MGEGQRDRTDLDIALPIFPPFAPTTERTRKTGSAKKGEGNTELRVMKPPFYAPTPPLTFYFLFDHRRSHITHRRNSHVQKKERVFPSFPNPSLFLPSSFLFFYFRFPPPRWSYGGQFGLLLPLLFFPRVNPGLIRISPLRCPALLPSSSLSIFMPPSSSHPPPPPPQACMLSALPPGIKREKGRKVERGIWRK